MTNQERRAVIRSIKNVFAAHVSGSPTFARQQGEGKLYELRALVAVVRSVRMFEGCQLALIGGNRLHFRATPGPVDRSRSLLQVRRSGIVIAEIMMDTEFIAMSAQIRTAHPGSAPAYADIHELDIALIQPGVSSGSRPTHEEVFLGAECKDTPWKKAYLRNMLGLRRELSLLNMTPASNRVLHRWPRPVYSNQPASALLLFCNDPRIRNYRSMSDVFDIEMRYLSM